MDATRSLLVVIEILLALFGLGWWISSLVLALSRPVARHWSAFCLLGLLAALASSAESGPRHALPVALSNLAATAAFLSLCRGVALFLGRRLGWALDTVALAAVLALGAADVAVGLDPYLRAAWVAAVLVATLVRGAATTWRPLRTEFGTPAALLVSGPMALAAALFAWRVATSLWWRPDERVLPMSADSTANWLVLLALMTMATVFNLSLAYMVVTRLVRRLQHLSSHDSLTGLMNRRALLAALQAEQGRVRRGTGGWALLLMDVDHFKRVNDEHGHGTGDEVLRQIGRALREASREVDTVARMGGEEFCVLAPLTDLHGAALLAERLRRAVTHEATLPGLAPVTVSVGVALSLPGGNETEAQALARADKALYRAKADGRDRVELG
ncbi:MAG: GGDEF domain-containing protein [Burkholderiaceae bacterium]